MNSSPELKVSILPAARSASASRSPSCHSDVQNHAWVASITFRGRSRMPSGVSSASKRSPSSRCAALRMSSGKVSWPLARNVVRAMRQSYPLKGGFSNRPLRQAGRPSYGSTHLSIGAAPYSSSVTWAPHRRAIAFVVDVEHGQEVMKQRRATPAISAGLEEDSIAGAAHLDRAAAPLHKADALGDPDCLAVRVGVPGRSRAQCEGGRSRDQRERADGRGSLPQRGARRGDRGPGGGVLERVEIGPASEQEAR